MGTVAGLPFSPSSTIPSTILQISWRMVPKGQVVHQRSAVLRSLD